MTTWRLTCECGWEAIGSEAAVVGEAQEHGRAIHNMDVTHDQAMAMAAPVDD